MKSYSGENVFKTPCQPPTFFTSKTSVPSTSCSFLFKKYAGKKHRVWDSFNRLRNIVLIHLYYTITLNNNVRLKIYLKFKFKNNKL